MAGIYIHVPYCRQACSYCNFHFSVSRRTQADFINAICKEIGLQRTFFDSLHMEGGRPVLKTLYFGGGTPSILSISDLLKIIGRLDACFSLDAVEEITLEANPDDLTMEYLVALKQTRVNRLSIGIQSFHLSDLKYMNRVHSPAQAFQSIKNANRAGFENISIDLIYGTPTMNDTMWRENLEYTLDLGIPHISAYALTVENKTPLEYMIRKGRQAPVLDDHIARQFNIMQKMMQKYGYLHYEISNFALPGHFSKHNLSYWQGVPYLGIGPSAHSYKNQQRFWNIANTSAYIDSVEKGESPHTSEILSETQALNEYVMTSLRTMWGCDLDNVAARWGNTRVDAIRRMAQKFIDKGLLEEMGSNLIITAKGKLFADGIAADLFE